MNNTKQRINADTAAGLIINALHTAADVWENIAATPDSEQMKLGTRMREQFIRQAQEAKAVCDQLGAGTTHVTEFGLDYLITAHAHNAHGPREVKACCADSDSARTIAQVLRGCGYNVTEEVQP